jgi:serine protease
MMKIKIPSTSFVLLPLAFVLLFATVAFAGSDLRMQSDRISVSDNGNTILREDLKDDIISRVDERIAGQFSKDEILVRFKNSDKFVRVPASAGKRVEELVAEYNSRADVLYAEPNYEAHAFLVPNDTYYGFQWHFDNPSHGGVHAQDAWDVGNGSGVVVAIIDTGVAYEDYNTGGPWWRREQYYRAPDLANTIFVQGYDFVNNDTHPNDDEGHGTHVTGTVAQSTNNSLGTAGLAYGASIMPVKVLNAQGSGSYADIADGIRYAADNGADVINMSLGGSASSNTLRDALEYAYDKGVTIVAASGNDGTGTVSYPAAYDEFVIAVGATRFDESRASYSNWGTALDIVAPGGDTSVDQNGDGYGDGVLQQTFGNKFNDWGYYFYQGTSMATPHVAGVAALVIGNGNATTPDDVRRALEETADDLGATGRDDIYGNGLVNAFAAMNWTSGPVDNPPVVTLTAPTDGATVLGSFTVTADASDDNLVDRVEFLIDGSVIAVDTNSPYETQWDTTLFVDGSYTVSAIAYDDTAQSAVDEVAVEVDNVNDAPVANAGADQIVVVGTSVLFDGSASTDSDGTIVDYSWDFGDSTAGSGISPSHTYTTVGVYTATLTVMDDDGAIGDDTVDITVTAVPSEITVFEDSFENNLSKWTQGSQNDWKRSSQRATDGQYSVEVDGRAKDAVIEAAVDMQGRDSATVTFDWYIEDGLDNGEYIAFDVSTNGGVTWVEKAKFRGNVDLENTWISKSVLVTGASNLSIRFRGKMSGSSEDANVDNVKVVAE